MNGCKGDLIDCIMKASNARSSPAFDTAQANLQVCCTVYIITLVNGGLIKLEDE